MFLRRLWPTSKPLCFFVLCLSITHPGWCGTSSPSVEQLKNIAATQSQNPDAQFNLGVYYFQQGDWEACIAPGRKVIALNPDDAQANYMVGTAFMQLKNYPEAMNYLKRAIDIDPQQVQARINLSLIYFREQKLGDALTLLKETLRIDPENVEATNNLAAIYLKSGKVDEALREYKHLIRLNPRSHQAYQKLAELYYERQQFEEVTRLGEQAKTAGISAATFLDLVGMAHLQLNNIKEAYQAFYQAKQINPGDSQAYLGLGLVAYKEADLELAVQNFKQAVKLNNGNLDAINQLAMAYEDQGEFYKSAYFYGMVAKSSPQDEEARKAFLKARDKAVEHYLSEGSKASLEGEFRRAIDNWERVLKLDPQNSNAQKFIKTAQNKLEAQVREHTDQAEQYIRQNQHQQAYRELRAALKLDPTSKTALADLDRVKLRQKEKDEIRTAVALDQIKRGNVKAAITEFRNTLKSDPNNLIAKQYLSKIQNEQKSGTDSTYRRGIELLSTGQYREAVANLEQALEMDSSNQAIKNLLFKARTKLRDAVKAALARGTELAANGRVAEAKEKFNEVLALDPENEQANDRLRKLTGTSVTAKTAVSKEEIKKMYYDGVSYYLDGQNRRAIDIWRKILTLDPDNQEAKSSIAKAETELKEMAKRGIKSE